MAFSSPSFIFGFLPIFLAAYFIIPPRFRNWLILIASLLFYFVDGGVLTFILCGSIIFNYFLALYFFSSYGFVRKLALTIGLVVNLTPLLYYKYEMFFIQLANDAASIIGSTAHFDTTKLGLPV